jgi:hypothetical protein
VKASARPPREAAPPYAGEGAHALWHVSEDGAISVLRPHRAASATENELLVWAVDTRHLPLFWFPRDCPRATFWAHSRTTADDVERFLAGDRRLRVHAFESGWFHRIRAVKLFAYRLPEESFERHDVGGYWVSRETVEPLARVALDDLLALHAEAGIELRVVPALAPVWQRVTDSTLDFSGIRLRNAAPPLGRGAARALR